MERLHGAIAQNNGYIFGIFGENIADHEYRNKKTCDKSQKTVVVNNTTHKKMNILGKGDDAK